MIPREQLERWKKLYTGDPFFKDLVGAFNTVGGLIAEVEAQAKENERLRAALGDAASRRCMFVSPCSPNYSKRDGWCAACIARAALKETP